MAQISINEKMMTVANPLPCDTESELYGRAGLFKPNAGDQFAFAMSYTYSSGPEAEMICLEPGQSRSLPFSVAADMMTHLKQRGLALYADESGRLMAMLTALREAQRFWHSVGAESLAKLYGRHGFRAEDEQTVKYRWPSYYINIEKEKAIRKEIERLEGQFNAALPKTLTQSAAKQQTA